MGKEDFRDVIKSPHGPVKMGMGNQPLPGRRKFRKGDDRTEEG